MSFSIQITQEDPAKETELIRAFTKLHGYQPTLPNPQPGGDPIPNPETRLQFLRQTVRKYIRDTAQIQRQREAEEARPPAATVTPIET